MSLRSKFVLFLSLIIIAICSGLSAYFIQNQRTAMTNQLVSLGKILVNNLAHNGRYGMITEDPLQFDRLIEGALAVEEVVYVVITGPNGRQLAAKSKGRLTDATRLARAPEVPVFPDPAAAKVGRAWASPETLVTPFLAPGEELLYDFAVTVPRLRSSGGLRTPLALELEESVNPGGLTTEPPTKALGVIQLGLTEAKRHQALRSVIWDIALLTGLIILVGILATITLASRIITPLKSLASLARQIAQGNLTASVRPTTQDEVGQLTQIFNQMARSLNDRDQAISSKSHTARKQVRQLTSLNQTAATIASTLDIDKLLDAVLQLCIENVGFARMVLVLRDPGRRLGYGARVVGVPEEIERAIRAIEIPLQDDGSMDSQLLIHGKPLLVPDITEVADLIYPPVLTLCRQVEVISFVAAPLTSKDRALGYVGADLGERRCTQEDLDLLVTIASHIAVAIDNARAYQALEHLTQTLEQRVQERTQELQNANERLVELDKLRAAFVSIVSHELRTPMTSIKGYVENMLDGLTGTLNDRQAYYLTRVKFNVERLTRMLNQLLDLSRIEAGQIELQIGLMSMPDLALDVEESLQSLAQKKSIVLAVQTEGAVPPIQGDRDKLYQVLTNLVGNAIKFTSQGGEVGIEVTALSEGLVRVCVSDNGCGVAPHEIEKVFDKFYRGETAPQDAVGAGLGLTITKHLVELHSGRIWVESTLGAGSQFYFTVPIAGPPGKVNHV
jgi:signal transduction histidine kinase